MSVPSSDQNPTPPEDDVVPEQDDVANVTTVAFGSVTITDADALYKPSTDGAAQGQDIFTDYQVVNRYEKDRSVYMGGVSSPTPFNGGSVAFVQLHAPTLLWICDWTACRFFSQPAIPNPTPSDPNWVLLDEHYEPGMLTVADDGTTPLYRISGTYVYGHRNPATVTVNDINFALAPWLDNAFDRSMPAAALTYGIADGKGPTGPGSILGGTFGGFPGSLPEPFRG